ncbi:MAG: hypothetical protein NTZ85_02280 [Bacteroidia bacterium]|nr:hypothetical protein [Bacteroidia bacterium]
MNTKISRVKNQLLSKSAYLLILLLISSSAFAQTPNKMSYQAVIRNAAGELMKNSTIGLQIQILQTSEFGAAVYVETHTPTTNVNGLVNIEIGNGSVVLGTFSGINWAAGPYYVKTETDITGGTSYSITGVSQILSVPYALHAKTVANYSETDPVFDVSAAKGITSTNILNWNAAYGWGNHASAGYLTSQISHADVVVDGDFTTNGILKRTSAGVYGIVTDNSANWNTSYSWGNHSGLYKPIGYIPSWTEISGKPSTLSGFGITDAMSTSHAANIITSSNISNWNSAYGWGDHATAGYVPSSRTITINGNTLNLSANNTWNVGTVTSVGMTLPGIFTVSGSPVTSIGTLTASLASQTANLIFASPNGTAGSPVFRTLANTDIPNLDWGKITTGKPTTLAGYGITDAMSTSHAAYSITVANISNWTSAFNWGDHAIAGYAKYPTQTGNGGKYLTTNGTTTSWTTLAAVAVTGSYNDLTNKPAFDGTFASLTDKPTTVSGYGITDAMTTTHPANTVTSTLMTNWNTSYGWGNHATAGYQPLITAGTVDQYWRGDKTWQALDKASVGLANVENVQLSTWAGSSHLTTLGTITSGTWNAGAINSNGSITANAFVKTGGTSSQFLKADGSVDANTYITSITDVADEFTANTAQTGFTLSQIPLMNSKVKMYINGVRISNSAYSISGKTLTYFAANNGSYILVAGDRIQFDYSY